MSRGGVFKLSGNMAIGGNNLDSYSTNQINEIKNSLRLLKAKQKQRNSEIEKDYANKPTNFPSQHEGKGYSH